MDMAGSNPAIKLIPVEYVEQHKELVEREIKHHLHLSSFGHPCIAQLQRVNILEANLALFLEALDTLTLDKYIEQHGGQLPLHIARRIFQQLILALEFCLRLGKCNRNVNPVNIHVNLQSSDEVLIKISNFSYIKDRLADSAPKTRLGTALYTAPEIIVCEPNTKYDGEAVDVWSCGILLSMMVFGQHPFMEVEPDDECTPGTSDPRVQLIVRNKVMQMMRNSLSGQLKLPAELHQQFPEVMSLLRGMLCPDPSKRMRMAQVLQHPWVSANMPPEWGELNQQLLAAWPDQAAAQAMLNSFERQARQIVQAALMMHRQQRAQQRSAQRSQAMAEHTGSSSQSGRHCSSDSYVMDGIHMCDDASTRHIRPRSSVCGQPCNAGS